MDGELTMAMESNNFKISYEVLDAKGNGQRIVLEQLGIGYEKLLQLQGQAVLPCVGALAQIFGSWHAQAVAASANPPAPAPGLDSSGPGKAKGGG